MKLLGVAAGFLAGASLIGAPACLAQEVEGHEAEGAERARHRHGISLFVGAATHTDPGETGGAVGLGYAYRISHRWALGAKVEFISSSLERDWVVLASAGFEAAEHLEFGFGIGVEEATRSELEDDEVRQEVELGPVVRVGGGYTFHLGRRTALSPEFAADIGDSGVTYAYGLLFSLGL